jgi:hypothetical protein
MLLVSLMLLVLLVSGILRMPEILRMSAIRGSLAARALGPAGRPARGHGRS